MTRTLTSALLLLTLAACGGDAKVTTPAVTVPTVSFSVAGAWTGTTQLSGSLVQFAGTLVDNNGSVSGNGTIIGGTLNCAASISGSRTDTNVSLNWTCTGFQPINYAASLAGTKLTGNLNGSGFSNLALTMNKQ
jgi:hypothetical protein